MDQRTAKNIMTPIDNVYMLPHNALLDFETTNEIIAHGYTRIPIYKEDRRRITSVLNVKDLAFVDPKDKIPVSTICNFYNRPFIYVTPNTTLRALFEKFRKESTHLAVIFDESKRDQEAELDYRTAIGLVTMEDVIEEILQEEIFDETDIINDNVPRKKRSLRFHNTDLWPFFNYQTDSKISPQLKIAALRYLVANTTYFAPNFVHTTILQGFLNSSFAVQHDYNHIMPESNTLYQSRVPNSVVSFILQGTLQVSVHNDRLQFEGGAFMMFGDDIFANVNDQFPQFPAEWDLEKLLQELGEKISFEPDYTVKMTTDVRCLECTAEAYFVLRYLTQELSKCKPCGF
uniref:CBS domain-containing protein n=1 Tax=Mesocestoides corti TaxID=53468 RepID=A0A5K3FJA1_MESCO